MLQKQLNRLRRKNRIRAKVSWDASRPRLSIFRSGTHIYAQLIDDTAGKTLAASSDLKIDTGSNVEKATKVGATIADLAKKLKVSEVVFDRGWFSYHGRVKALADAARQWGLKF